MQSNRAELWKLYNEDQYLVINPEDIIKKPLPNSKETSDVYQYWDGSELRVIWAKIDVQHRISITVDVKSVEDLDRWSWNFGWHYRFRFNHGRIYKIVSIDNELVDDKYLVLEFGEWEGALSWGKIVEEGDLDKIRNWDKETANKEG